MAKPVRVHVRMYQVGFGDCFLVTVDYDTADQDGRTERQVLVDFGSTRGPEKFSLPMAEVAARIEADCGGRLDVVIVTHRHKDHLGGFGSKSASEIITRLEPKLVLRPWTEDPQLAADASAPAAAGTSAVGMASRQFAARLLDTQQVVERVASDLDGMTGFGAKVHQLALEGVRNAAAIEALDAMSAPDKGRYLHRDMECDLSDVVPGLELTVLGPPTVDQDADVAKMADEHDEFWMLRLHDSLAAAASTDQRREVPDVGPGPTRWLVDRLASQRLHSVARLVRSLDDVLNNTSLNLLLRVGKVDMLFSGDAQIENWQGTLRRLIDDDDLADRLRNVDLYKVGHHGSRNATPRSLHKLWTERDPGRPKLTALMSTRSGVHGETDATAVPRATLVDALAEVATVLSTETLEKEQGCHHVVAEATGGPFTIVS